MKIRSLLCILLLTGLIAAISLLTAADSPAKMPKPGEFTFVVIGDSQPWTPDGKIPDVFRDLIKRIDTLNPAFVVHTGDRIYGTGSSVATVRRQYEEFKEAVKPLRAKLYQAIGNHEIQGSIANQEFFKKEIGGLYYSFDHGNSHFTVLNSQIVGEEGRITGKQLEWLKDDLHQARAAKHRFVFVHMPLFPVDGHLGRALDSRPKERDALHKLFVAGRVDTVFCGHEHLYDEQTRNGVRYIITGGGGARTWPSFQGKGDFYHFIIVNVKGDKVEMKGYRPAQRGRLEEEFPIGKTRRQ